MIAQMQFRHSEAFFFQSRQNIREPTVGKNQDRPNVHGYGRAGAYNQNPAFNQNRNNMHGRANASHQKPAFSQSRNNEYGGSGVYNQRKQVNPIS